MKCQTKRNRVWEKLRNKSTGVRSPRAFLPGVEQRQALFLGWQGKLWTGFCLWDRTRGAGDELNSTDGKFEQRRNNCVGHSFRCPVEKQRQLVVQFVNGCFHMDPPFSLSSANYLLIAESFSLLSFTAKRKAPHENKTCAITCYVSTRCQGSHKIVLRLRAMNSIWLYVHYNART